MLLIKMRGKDLVVEDIDRTITSSWEHRAFLGSILGLRIHSATNSYISSSPHNLYSLLDELIAYFNESSIPFETDEAISSVLKRKEFLSREFKSATEHVSQENSYSEKFSASKFQRVLKDYQITCVERQLNLIHGANFSVPGSGKTTMVYASFDTWRSMGQIDKILVIGPLSSFMPWEEEYAACFGETPRSARLSTTREERALIYEQLDQYDLFLCHYQTAANDISELIEICQRYRFLVVIDESHNIKRISDGVRADALLELAPYCTRRMILSGTPMPNDFRDLWTQFTFLWPGKQLLGEREVYRFLAEDSQEQENIRKKLRPFFVRVKKSDLDLPTPKFEKVRCELNEFQDRIYQALSIKFLSELELQPEEKHQLRQWRKSRMVRLIQAASNPTLLAQYSQEFNLPPLNAGGISLIQLIEKYPQYEVPAKIHLAVKMIHELISAGEKVLVWSSFILNIRMLQTLISDLRPFVVYGAVPRDESEDVEFNREQQIRNFKESQHACVLIANPAACAESISLHKICRHAIYLDRTFDAGQYMQSLDRIHRIGTTDEVTYHVLIANNTIDETIERRLDEKQKQLTYLLEDEFPVGTMGAEPFELSRTPVEEETDFRETIIDLSRHAQP